MIWLISRDEMGCFVARNACVCNRDKADGVAACLAQGNGLYEVRLCLAAIVKKDSVVLRKVLLCCSFFLEVDLLLMDI